MVKITEEELVDQLFDKTVDGILTQYERGGLIFEFGGSNIPVLRRRINKEETVFIGGYENFEDFPPRLTSLYNNIVGIIPEPYTHLKIGLVMQWYVGSWHEIYVVVKVSERFVWLKPFKELKDENSKAKRVLKHKLEDEGFSTTPCPYNSKNTKYIGKIIDL